MEDLPKKGVGFDVEYSDSVIELEEESTPSLQEEATPEEQSVKEPSFDTIPALNAYQIKPDLHDKFKGNPVKEIIRNVLSQVLGGKSYDVDGARRWCRQIANEINTKVRELQMKRYKHIVQVVIGELKGAGVKCGVRCLWDSETDGFTSEKFMNETMFCVTVVFAVYLY